MRDIMKKIELSNKELEIEIEKSKKRIKKKIIKLNKLLEKIS